MLVNPEPLRAFADQVDRATVSTNGLDAEDTAADGLPGSGTQWAARNQ